VAPRLTRCVLALSLVVTLLAAQRAPDTLGADAGWTGSYFSNTTLSGTPVLVRQDASIAFSWSSGSPGPGVPSDNFSVRWTRSIAFSADRYKFTTITDDGVRLYVDGQRVIDKWVYQSSIPWSAEVDLTAGEHAITMEYFEGTGGAVANLSWQALSASTTAWRGEYFANRDLGAPAVLTRDDDVIDFNWGPGSPGPSIPSDNFSARWSRLLSTDAGRYRFATTTDDGVRLYVDGKLLIDKWVYQSTTTWTAEVDLAAGTHPVVMEFFEGTASAIAKLETAPIGLIITEPATDGQVVHPADVHMETAAPSRPDHACTDWEIVSIELNAPVWADYCDSLNLVHVHLGDGTFVNAYAGRTELEYAKSYLLRVRDRFSTGTPEWSAWSERRFVTAEAPAPGTAVPWTLRQPGYIVEEVTSDVQLPVNIAFVPDPGTSPSSPLFYVTELYGSIRVVSRDGTVSDYIRGVLNYRPSGVFPGSGEQGLTGLVVDAASGDVFASMLYQAYAGGPTYPKVMRFHSNHGGTVAGSSQTILDMAGETQGASHQVSNLSIGPDGKLYVHNGDAFVTATAQNLDSFRGKILRMNLDGTAATDNPFYNAADGITARDYVYASGFRNPFGGDGRAADGSHYIVENGPSVDRLSKLVRGRNYLWDGTDASMRNYALYNWSPAVAPVNAEFIDSQTFGGSGFPASVQGHLYVSESGPTYATGPQTNGKRISEFVLDAVGNVTGVPTPLIEYTGTGKATAVGLAAGPDGLYFTELYRDQGATSPTDPGARILRIRYVGSGGANQPPTVALTAPSSGAQYAAPARIDIAANAADPDGSVTKVEFFAGPSKIGEDTTAPYTYSWTNVAAGTYSLTARATDNQGATTTSAPVSVGVSQAADFSLTVTPSASSIKRGSSATYLVTVTANATFSGSADLSVSGLLNGLTASFSSGTVTLSPGGSATSTLTITAPADGPFGNDSFAIVASSGSLSRQVSASIKVRR
jgi:glucose/arabinose dehydrogenase